MFGSDLILTLIAITICLAVSAFFSAAETALTALTRARVYHLVMEGNRRAQIISKLRREKESLIGAILLGNNVVNILASVLATSLAIHMEGTDALAAVTFIMTFLVVVFSEVLPKTYAIQNAERVSLTVAPIVRVVVFALSPITRAVQLIIRGVFHLFGVDVMRSNTLVSVTDVVRGTIELHHSEGRMIKQDRDMLGSILDLNDIEVKHIMVHRKQMITVDAGLPPAEIVRQAIASLHTRVPLWKGTPDNVIGVLHVKDVVKAMHERNGARLDEATLARIIAKPWFIPETTTLRDQLIAFRRQRQHFAVVVDEYGTVQGIVTLEDIIEEIVGDIGDEHDEVLQSMQKISDNVYAVDGGVTIRDLNRELDWSLPDEHASTVAGLLIHEAQQIPSVGACYELHGVRFTVETRDRTRIKRVRVEKLLQAADAESEIEEE